MKKQNKTKKAIIKDLSPIFEMLVKEYIKCKWWQIRKKRTIAKLGGMIIKKIDYDLSQAHVMEKMEEKK